jgi:hypothetical protein
MKNVVARFWNGLFPFPSVSVLEDFFLRALLAGALFWFFPPALQIQSQPEPVGLAHWFDLTWLSGAGVFPIYRAVFFGLLVLYVAGFALPVTLPLMTLVHILPATLHNSQGFTFHGNQIMSLTLVGLSVMTLYFAVTRRTGVVYPVSMRRLLVPVVVFIEAVLLWMTEKNFMIVSLGWQICPEASPLVIGWCHVLAFIAVFAVVVALPSALAGAWNEAGSPSPLVRSWALVTAQFVIASAYLISVFSKFIRSDGEWLVNSYYIALDFVKTLRQNYYSSLDPQYAVDPPAYIVMMMQHPVITALFFDFGVALEALMIFAVGHRKWTFAFGASLIFMHITIAKIMNLFFPTHVAMLAIFWVAPLLLARLPGARSEKERPA